MSKRELINKCKNKLVTLKRKYMSMLKERMISSNDEKELIDKAFHEQEAQTKMKLNENISTMLPEIDRALRRIEQGNYGKCEITGEDIEPNRLLAVPWTRVSMKAVRQEAS